MRTIALFFVLLALAACRVEKPDVIYNVDIYLPEEAVDTNEMNDTNEPTDTADTGDGVDVPDILEIDFTWTDGWPFTRQLTPFQQDVYLGEFRLHVDGDEPITVAEFPVLFVGDNTGTGFFSASNWRTFFENCTLKVWDTTIAGLVKIAGPVNQDGARIHFEDTFTVEPNIGISAGVICDLNGGPYEYPIEFAIDVPRESEIVHDGDGVDIGNYNGTGSVSTPGNRVVLPVD